MIIIQLLALLTFITWSFITACPTNMKLAPKIAIRIPATINPTATLDLFICMVADSVTPEDRRKSTCPVVSVPPEIWMLCCCILQSSCEQWWMNCSEARCLCLYTTDPTPRSSHAEGVCAHLQNFYPRFIPIHVKSHKQSDDSCTRVCLNSSFHKAGDDLKMLVQFSCNFTV